MVVGAINEDSSTTGVNTTPNEGSSDSGAVYVFVRNLGVWSQQAYLKPSNTGFGDWFGWSVAISGDTVAIGARAEDSNTTGVNTTPNDSANDSGAAYIFVRNSGVWSQQAYLKASNTGVGDRFGVSIAISGDTVVVGAPAEGSSTIGVNTTPNEGASLAGAAYVFVRSSGVWTQTGYLKASNTGAGDQFGTFVAVSGDTVVVGVPFEASSATGINGDQGSNASANSGAVYVFQGGGEPPVANAGPDQIVECTAQNQANVTLDGRGSSDPDKDPLGFSWSDSGGVLSTADMFSVPQAVGTKSYTLTVDDGSEQNTDSVSVKVQDTKPPAVTLTMTPDTLSPADHRMVSVTANLKITDCDPNAKVKLVSVTSNEADSGLEPADRADDIQQEAGGTDDRNFLLRAERAPAGKPKVVSSSNPPGRTYTITYEVTDSGGRKKTVSAAVRVP